MTVAAAVVDELCTAVDEPCGFLGAEQAEQIGHHGPEAQTEAQEDKGSQVQTLPRTRGSRAHDHAVLSLIVAVQLGWLTALGYGVFLLL
jgi:hypothetical protein